MEFLQLVRARGRRWYVSHEHRYAACVFQSLSDDVLAGVRTLNASSVERFLHRSDEVAGTHRFFHWELEFPEVFFDRNGRRLARPGFDAVIGNPPWDMVRADQGDAGTRARARRTAASTIRFTRDSGVYAAQSAGHANRYQLFLERTLDLTRPGGRFGLVLPSGLATDHGSTALRRMLLSRSDVDAIVGLDNHRRIFPIHRSVRFLLLTATAGAPTSHLRCQFGIDSLSGLETLSVDHDQRAFPVQLSTDALGRLSGDALAIPNLRSRMDVVIAERAASLFLPLGHERAATARTRRLSCLSRRPCSFSQCLSARDCCLRSSRLGSARSVPPTSNVTASTGTARIETQSKPPSHGIAVPSRTGA